ncbi:MAG: DEAD/DEAH box helicase [Deltaproteobacteria bacterium]|nr:DEAD/DEAH box helicase [Deltaproteobacteria bacterium]
MSKSPFKRVQIRKTEEIDLETLFKDLKNRSPKIRDLFAHQADILREYYKFHRNSRDVGIELPTGSGKTLVGLLIGEWRRRILNQRVLYVCPTKQLAHQVHEQSKDYDIDTRIFVGSSKHYDRKNLSLYRHSQTIAISTYSGLFNINPEFNDPQTIILDDAHGAETYIGSMWSLDIDRQKHLDLYMSIIEIFEKDLPEYFLSVILRGRREYVTQRVEKIPFGAFERSLPVLRETLNSKISDDDLELYFSWLVIQDGLHACHVYISYDHILIRPYIPPTLVHRPFSDAEQRIYMSATLGRGGELERITGIREIQRISTPKIYKSSGIGRRFFIFPDFSLDPDEYNN